MATERSLHVVWPWQDRNRRFSWLKAITFALMFGPALWMVNSVATGEFGFAPLGDLMFWSGIWSMAILLLALAVTPAATIFRWGRLIVVRRMIGVTALVYTLAHIVVYFALRFWNFATIAHEVATSVSLLAATASSIGLIALGATSLDAAIQRMGTKNWNRLHNTVYVLTGLALIHFLIVPDIYPEQYLACGMFFWLMMWRWLNVYRRGADVRVLAILAVGACLFTAMLEAGWIWVYYGYEPLGTLKANFSLVLGVSSAWKVLIFGLLVALAAAGWQAFGRHAAAIGVRHPR